MMELLRPASDPPLALQAVPTLPRRVPALPAFLSSLPAPAFLARVCRWAAAGGGSLALQLAIQGLLISWLALPARLGILLAYELALVAHFLVNDRWVFHRQTGMTGSGDVHTAGGVRPAVSLQSSGSGAWRRLAEFHVSALAAEALTLAIAFTFLSTPLADLLGPALAPVAATVTGTAAAVTITFTASFFWIWRPTPS